jgi:crotonobetainyl-CoA:carnitine CoA-transferase CaiB-like acyl-CoA transferase
LSQFFDDGYLQQRSPESQARGLDESQLTAPAAAFKFASDGPLFNDYCARHGEDTESVLGELGVTAEQIAELRGQGVI